MNVPFSLLISLLLSAAWPVASIAQRMERAEPLNAGLNAILGRPSDRSITLSVVANTASEAFVEFGSTSGIYTERTPSRILEAGVPCDYELAPLKANTRYSYRLMVRTPATKEFSPEAEGMFHTQRSAGSTFTFGVQGDSHPEREGKMYDRDLYVQTMRNVSKNPPDFYLALGDDFSIERLISRRMLSQADVDRVYAQQRPFLGIVGRSSALYLVNGNHEQAARYLLDGTGDNAAVLAARARTRFYPLPAPDGFYTGDAVEVPHAGLLRDYYSWTWGDALFVVIDPYWHSPGPVDNEAGVERRDAANKGERRQGGKNRDLWSITLGDAQYRWMTRTLTQSKARWKFVFSHHVLGTGRGGVEMAGLAEWGGKDRRGVSAFAEKRPGWERPIHELMVQTGVTIFFQGHDHIYARQELDGITYQSCPNPADRTYQAFNREAYRSGDILPNSGHLSVTVSPESVSVDYVRSFLPADESDGRRNASVGHSYTITRKRVGEPQ